MVEWRVYYDGGETFSNEDGAACNAPGRGVLVIVQRDVETGRSVWKEEDFYWWKDGRWLAGDLAGLLDYLGCCGQAKVLQGRTVDDAKFRATVQRATDDPDFPQKSAYHLRER